MKKHVTYCLVSLLTDPSFVLDLYTLPKYCIYFSKILLTYHDARLWRNLQVADIITYYFPLFNSQRQDGYMMPVWTANSWFVVKCSGQNFTDTTRVRNQPRLKGLNWNCDQKSAHFRNCYYLWSACSVLREGNSKRSCFFISMMLPSVVYEPANGKVNCTKFRQSFIFVKFSTIKDCTIECVQNLILHSKEIRTNCQGMQAVNAVSLKN